MVRALPTDNHQKLGLEEMTKLTEKLTAANKMKIEVSV